MLFPLFYLIRYFTLTICYTWTNEWVNLWWFLCSQTRITASQQKSSLRHVGCHPRNAETNG